MRNAHRIAAAALVAVAVALGACTGGGAQVEQRITTVSKGKELEDLKRALDAGAIDQSEYDKLRRTVMQRQD